MRLVSIRTKSCPVECNIRMNRSRADDGLASPGSPLRNRPGHASPSRIRSRCWPRPSTTACARIPRSSGSCAPTPSAVASPPPPACPPSSSHWLPGFSSAGQPSASSPSAGGIDARRRSPTGTLGGLAARIQAPASSSRSSVETQDAELSPSPHRPSAELLTLRPSCLAPFAPAITRR